ncbi:MAG: hypothetical protein C4570_06505 [Ammonifex sp.]|jgi:hypothetical protein|nr:MAG: hypothetical protein C4570_06505 [Ammonifex sp.]
MERDARKDLELLEKIPFLWEDFDDNIIDSDMNVIAKSVSPTATRYILEAREGWRHWIQRAQEAQAEVKRLGTENANLSADFAVIKEALKGAMTSEKVTFEEFIRYAKEFKAQLAECRAEAGAMRGALESCLDLVYSTHSSDSVYRKVIENALSGTAARAHLEYVRRLEDVLEDGKSVFQRVMDIYVKTLRDGDPDWESKIRAVVTDWVERANQALAAKGGPPADGPGNRI